MDDIYWALSKFKGYKSEQILYQLSKKLCKSYKVFSMQMKRIYQIKVFELLYEIQGDLNGVNVSKIQ